MEKIVSRVKHFQKKKKKEREYAKSFNVKKPDTRYTERADEHVCLHFRTRENNWAWKIWPR